MFVRRTLVVLGLLSQALIVAPSNAAPVNWVNWTSGTAGASGSATGVLNIGESTVDVDYSGEIAFIQTAGGINYWNPSSPYISALVDNAPDTTDIIALSRATSKTLSFSVPVQDLFFAVVSLNGNGYRFDQDFEVVGFGAGYWGNGTLNRAELGGGQFQLNGTGEPHGVIRFTGAVSSITWTSLTNENWNGFTVGTYGIAPPIPEPETWMLMLAGLGIALLAGLRRR
ncbi:PEP-CTERM sorting domain-containing protein [Methyloversatilis sp.]|uniref:PEP-CTERM sorting domain-containing protein n=1 Tax=Methyloversatilis sp. TaxID=2569862 RepID=UPI002735B652|nr:PEP-CTERM sorting domain-containing protein [Methyloversatilis sp.]MDP2868099.1 PEP-CTERM sorting domain-containing protein [Methyloversatilis sp.]MDP3454915.1 PEP-CTERM sorting domain-containing protein [Methyloversatilis sp.]MDP3577947.1 PEP-CTERM sorting domain-containing protein [Methyloversatilis sp.]